ncbi:MAG: DUF6383 domain-containing protein [Tannerellaceae bacterium]|jgi:hypothetical protein|nr:DUF6383 domain-containing protein [Tannerellaceae bacterium]
MNKKFFTLIASAFMLVASLGTLSAQVPVPASPALETDGLTATEQARNLYHLIGETSITPAGLLYLDNNGNIALDPTAGALGNALWCINITDREDQGLNPTYTFTNKGGEGGGGILAVSAEDLLLSENQTDSINVLGGNLLRWDFSRVYKNALQTQRPFVLYYGEPDSVLTFVLKQDPSTSAFTVGVKSFPANTVFAYPTVVGNDAMDSVIFFSVYRPASKVLTANEFNTIINTERAKFVGLQFSPAPTDWSEFQTAIKAEDVTATVSGLNTLPVGSTWLKFYQNTTDLNKKYLRVDTAYTGEYGTKFLKFAFGDGPSAATPQKVAIEMQYYFRAEYFVLNDSLAIDVAQAIFPKDNEIDHTSPTGHWFNYPHKTVWAGVSGTWPTTTPLEGDSLHLKLQDLIANERSILTIGTKEVSTRIGFGLTGCQAPTLDITSVPENLYTITDNRGYYLIMPIYTDTVQNSPLAPIWVKLADNIDPNQIPAYQWAVEKTRNANLETSPVKITNREFDGIRHLSLQLYKSSASSLFDGQVNVATSFHEVPLAQKRDSLLGYKDITAEESRFNTYVFNYLHAFDDGKFLDVKRIGTDTSVYVASAMTQFEIIPYRGTGHINYGYWTPRIPNLSRLYKRSYTIRVKDASRLTNSGKTIMVNKNEHRYVVGGAIAQEDTAIFLLKTNNTKNGVNYYALVDTGSYGYRYYAEPQNKRVIKVGIDDNSLWAYEQVQKETRTSAFAIRQWTEPLYRRFDGGTYGSREIKEIFGTSANAPQWLKFTKQNNFGNEFLFENSPRGAGSPDPNKPGVNDYRDDLTARGAATISFLGLYNIRQYPENGSNFRYTLYVDTAFVQRKANGEGAIDSKEFTAKPQYLLAVRPEFVTGDTIYRITKDSVWDSSGNTLLYVTSDTSISVRPSFTRAFWVYNAQDSIGRLNGDNQSPRRPDYVGKFAYGAEGTTRLAFVDGVHMGDTFYVLRNNPLTTAIDSSYLISNVHPADKHYLGRNTHYRPRWNRTGGTGFGNNAVDYSDNSLNGKSMVFQFRLIDPQGIDDPNNAQSRAFLIESRNNEGTRPGGGSVPTEEMGPQFGRWIKIQNGVPVISNLIDIVEAQQNGAEIFNVMEGDVKNAVGNEPTPSVSAGVQVIGEAGAVTIVGAAGKNVAISNILGQAVAKQAITSDNVTIALPKGIVVVAVDGEPAVKAIVK